MSKLFLVYGIEGCVLCEQAKKMIEQKQQSCLYKTVGKDITQTNFFEMLEALGATETRSLPQIVMIGEDNLAFYVGAGQKGLMELTKLLK